jgi:hypothetical protein
MTQLGDTAIVLVAKDCIFVVSTLRRAFSFHRDECASEAYFPEYCLLHPLAS